MKLQTLKPRLQTQRASSKNNWGSGRGGRPWRRLKAKIHLRDKYTCQCCGLVTMELECDHIVNTAQGGTDDLDNLQSLCKPCHDKKSLAESKAGMR